MSDLREPDLRVCVVGDSFVAGIGDPRHLGWAGRLAAGSHAAGHPATVYNLGVRRDTSTDVLARWRAECAPRLPCGTAAGVVFSFGVNDSTVLDGALRVAPGVTAAVLDALLGQAAAAGWPALVVGPPPIDDESVNERLERLDASSADVCARHETAYVSVVTALRADPVWRQEVHDGDGAHPGAAGYDRLAALVRPAWSRFLTTLRA